MEKKWVTAYIDIINIILLVKEYFHPSERVEDKPSKEEFQVAKWIRKNVPIKRTKFLNHNVEYFTGE